MRKERQHEYIHFRSHFRPLLDAIIRSKNQILTNVAFPAFSPISQNGYEISHHLEAPK